MTKSINIITDIQNLINKNLHETLRYGKRIDSSYSDIYSPLVKSKDKHLKPKAKLGIYLVNIRVLNSKQDKLYYSYKY